MGLKPGESQGKDAVKLVKPVVPVDAKCQCGKIYGHHRATDKACPLGKRHRTMGYTMFGRDTFTEKKISKPKKKSV